MKPRPGAGHRDSHSLSDPTLTAAGRRRGAPRAAPCGAETRAGGRGAFGRPMRGILWAGFIGASLSTTSAMSYACPPHTPRAAACPAAPWAVAEKP